MQLDQFLTQLTSHFPETIEYSTPDETNGDELITRTLNRQIIYINDKTQSNNNIIDKLPNNIDRYCPIEDDETDKDPIMKSFLDILDINLGETYEKVSGTIYENNLPWKTNKWDEMLTPSLIYVSYWDTKTMDKIDKPLLYMSFMLTEEIDITEYDKSEMVVYLYEIQLLPLLRGQKIGEKLINYLRQSCISYNNEMESLIEEEEEERITSIALTVFSSNDGAIRFYQRLGFQFTAGSPRDEKIAVIAGRTRRGRSNSAKKYLIKKPIYYLLYMLL